MVGQLRIDFLLLLLVLRVLLLLLILLLWTLLRQYICHHGIPALH
jgi:hypothetical protein